MTTRKKQPTLVLEHRPLPWFDLLVEELAYPILAVDTAFTPWPETAELAALHQQYRDQFDAEMADLNRQLDARVTAAVLAIGWRT
jgi:hypothetical protein